MWSPSDDVTGEPAPIPLSDEELKISIPLVSRAMTRLYNAFRKDQKEVADKTLQNEWRSK
jgi:hypothetical protein